jgi:endonuclease III
VIELLVARYGLPRHGNPARPLDDLFYIILSNKTAPRTAARVYRNLRRAFPSWDRIDPRDPGRLLPILQPAGLGELRSAQIARIISRLRDAFGRATLAPLKRMQPGAAESFLTSLPGVSLKVAKCVLMYTLGHQVLPVDVHVHRVSRRLGWTHRKRADQSHGDLETLIPPPLRFAYHVSAICHGRDVCRPKNPKCESCTVRRYCNFYRSRTRVA